MKRVFLMSIVTLAMPLAAQPSKPAAATDPAPKSVAVVNGEVITVEKLDSMWNNMGVQMRDQYEKNGGKGAFLENYLRKRLVLQEAIKSGFDKRPDVQVDMDAARESALFDRYVRDVVAVSIVTEADIRKYYDEHHDDFATPERLRVRHIIVSGANSGPAARTKGQALERIKGIAAELLGRNIELRRADPAAAERLRMIYFADAARKYSEDAAASSGGDLGWVTRGQLDSDFEEAAWHLKKGTMSGVVESKYGYHLIAVEDHEAAGTLPYPEARSTIREFLLTQKATDVMTAVNKLTQELRLKSKISVFPENVK
jgi:peptidyl-prolyl cis-trans isomerase C